MGTLLVRKTECVAATISLRAKTMTALVCYGIGVTLGNPIRMSGNVIYDYFAGAVLNPRLGNIDIKMWCEVRIPWVLQFLLALAGCAKQYETYGYVSPNQAFMVLGTGLYINACAKGEELIPQTWDMVYEKFGWLLSFWNLAGVPFSYSYPILYMATHDPSLYRYPVWATVLLYATLLFANWVWDSSMSQKSYFKMETDGNTRMARKSFPQMPWARVKNPKFIQTKHGNRLLTDGWWKYARKPVSRHSVSPSTLLCAADSIHRHCRITRPILYKSHAGVCLLDSTRQSPTG